MPEMVFDHAASPSNRGTMESPSAVGKANLGGQPPEVIVYLQVSGDTIVRAMFDAHGCGYTIACCSVLTEIIEGKSVEFCRTLTPAAILAELAAVPAHRQFCAALAVEALQDAVAQVRPNIVSASGARP
jgi:NifU-like protein involved in Fe-S cluster formation